MWGGTEEDAAIHAIHAALDSGINLLDTAPIYGFGRSEEIVGKAIKDRRDQVVLATKCGLIWHMQKGLHYFNSDENHPDPNAHDYSVYKCLAPDAVQYEVEQSLQRLGTDRIDLYQTHWQEDSTLISDTMAVLLKLKDQGKIRAIGVSNATTDQMSEYRTCAEIDSDQERFSMLDSAAEQTNLPYCAEANIAFLAYCPIAQGLLTGKMGPDRMFNEGDQRATNQRYSVENRAKVADLLVKFQPIANTHDISITQLVIAWTVQQPGCTHALVGARTPAQAIENARAGDIQLSAEELEAVNSALASYRQSSD
jgi:aryl-alcohol dehydrogenase-like predicted oxidoreductase